MPPYKADSPLTLSPGALLPGLSLAKIWLATCFIYTVHLKVPSKALPKKREDRLRVIRLTFHSRLPKSESEIRELARPQVPGRTLVMRLLLRRAIPYSARCSNFSSADLEDAMVSDSFRVSKMLTTKELLRKSELRETSPRSWRSEFNMDEAR